MPKPAAPLPVLGELEHELLELLWRVPSLDVVEAHARVGKRRGIALNTVGSALERLYRKHLACREKVSHAYRYTAALSREEFTARRVLEAAGGVKALTGAGLLSAFVNLVAVDEGALERLEALIVEKRNGRGTS